MKKFRFKFEKILSFRRHQEKEKQRALAEVLQAKKKQEDEIDELLDQRTKWQRQEKNKLIGKILPHQLGGYSRYFLKLKKMEMAGYESIKLIEEEAGKRQELLIEAARNRKIYDKLKERHQEKYSQEVDLLLQKENDETGLKLFFQNR